MNTRFARTAAALVAAVLLLGACTGDEATAPLPAISGSVGTPQSWRRIADAPTSRQEVAAAVVGGKIYVVGGLLEAGDATDAVEVYDPTSNTWTSGPSLPISIHHAMAAATPGGLLVMGGFVESLGGAASERVFWLNLRTNSWLEFPAMQRPRGAGAAVAVGEEIVVLGGISGGRHVAPAEIFDIAANTWSDGAAIPTLRDHVGAATDGTLVYAAGGRRAGGHFATFDVYDPAKDRWSDLPDMPTARSGLGAAFANGLVVTVGGEGPRIFPEVEAYDIEARRWMRLPDLAVPVHGVGVVSDDSNPYALVGGIRVGGAPTRVCQVLSIA